MFFRENGTRRACQGRAYLNAVASNFWKYSFRVVWFCLFVLHCHCWGFRASMMTAWVCVHYFSVLLGSKFLLMKASG